MEKEVQKLTCPSCEGEGAIFIDLSPDKWDYDSYGNFILCDDCEATGFIKKDVWLAVIDWAEDA